MRHEPAQDYNEVSNSSQCVAIDKTSHITEAELPKAPDDDLWEHLRQGFALDLSVDNKRIRAQRNWYLRHPKYMQRVTERAQRYLPYIVNQLEKNDLPLELALLPIVESAFDPFAYSHGSAAGIWQFIPSTAKIYGVEIDWWYDGRRDIVASTDAAIQFLQSLNRRFKGDWLHALAAYNSGQGRVGRAIRKNRKRNKSIEFWDLKLPRETQAYGPKLLALAQIVAEPGRYGITLPPLHNTPSFKIFPIKDQIDLALLADLAGVQIGDIYMYNPGYNRWATHPNRTDNILIPTAHAEHFATQLQSLDRSQLIKWQRYKVRSGDSLIKIAKKFQTDINTIRQANNIAGNSIRVGRALLVPTASRGKSHYSLSAQSRLDRKQNRAPKSASSQSKYTVRSGDSFWSIAKKFGVNSKQLAKWNGMAPKDKLKIGQTLVIWQKSSNANRKPTYRKINYRVRKGDSISRIASKFQISQKSLIRLNKLDSKKYLKPGQKLTLYVDVTNMQ